MDSGIESAIEAASSSDLFSFADYILGEIECVVGDNVDGLDENSVFEILKSYPNRHAGIEVQQ
jgi:hypothetical protein